jgi:hypothetical protein
MKTSKTPKLWVRSSDPNEILRVTSTDDGDEVYMRAHPEGDQPGKLVRVHVTPAEVRRLRECTEVIDALGILTGIIARLSRLN